MMVYGWSNRDLLKDKKRLSRLLNREKDIVKRNRYFKVIDKISSNLMDDELSELNIRTLKSNLLYDIANNITLNNRYYELCSLLCLSSKAYIDRRNRLYNEALNIDYNGINTMISNDDIIAMIHDNYESLDEELFKLFKCIYDKNSIRINFKDEIKSLDGHAVDGFCIFIDILNKNYIQVLNEEGVGKLINAAHEIGHAISNLYNPINADNREDDYLTEVASIFFELVISYDVARNIDPLDTVLKNMESFDNYYDYSYLLSHHSNLVYSWFNNDGKINKEYYKELKRMYGLSRNRVIESMNSSLDNDGPYVISYMVALYLFSIYKQDKKSSIELLKKIINSSNEDTLLVINKYLPNLSDFKKEINIINDDVEDELQKIKTK